MLQMLKSQFDKEAQAAQKTGRKSKMSEAERQEAEAEMVFSAAATMKLDRVGLLKKALHTDSKSRADIQNDAIMKFLQQESSFKTYFPEGTLFSAKDMETVRDGCKLRSAARNEVLSKSGEFIDDVYLIIAGYICLENVDTGACSYRQSGDIIGVDALEKGALIRKNNVVAATDIALCSIDMGILLKSVGVKVGSDGIVDPEDFITKYWKSLKLWDYATSSANTEPLFEFLSPAAKQAGRTEADLLMARAFKTAMSSSDGETSTSSFSSDEERPVKGPKAKLSERTLVDELKYVCKTQHNALYIYIYIDLHHVFFHPCVGNLSLTPESGPTGGVITFSPSTTTDTIYSSSREGNVPIVDTFPNPTAMLLLSKRPMKLITACISFRRIIPSWTAKILRSGLKERDRRWLRAARFILRISTNDSTHSNSTKILL